MHLREALIKQAAEDLKNINIYVTKGTGGQPIKAQIVVKPSNKEPSKKELAIKAISSAAKGATFAGALPYALLGTQLSGEKTKFFGKGIPLSEIVNPQTGKDAEAVAKRVSRIKKGFRALALAGALGGAGTALYPTIKRHFGKKKTGAMLPSSLVGRFKNVATTQLLGAPGRNIKQLAVNIQRPIKQVIKGSPLKELTRLE